MAGRKGQSGRQDSQKMKPYLAKAMQEHNLDMIYLMLTDILDESSELLCEGHGARATIIDAFDLPEDTDRMILKGVVSRKKQLIPALVGALQQ